MHCRFFVLTPKSIQPRIQPQMQPLDDVLNNGIRKMKSVGTMAILEEGNRLESNRMNIEERTANSSQSGSGAYEIHVKGHLNSQWSEWLEGMQVELLDNGEMILSGTIVDQSALMGILYKLNRLNLTILSLNEVKKKDQEETK